MPSWHPPDSDSGMVQDDESTIKVHNNANACFFKIPLDYNDFDTIHGRPARIHTAPAESTVDSTYCLPQALCEYARGDRESWRNR